MNKKLLIVVMLMSIIVSTSQVIVQASSYSRGVGVEIAQDFEPISPEPDEGIVEIEREEEQSNNESSNQGNGAVIINGLPWTGNEFRIILLLVLLIGIVVVYKINEKQKNKYKGAINNV